MDRTKGCLSDEMSRRARELIRRAGLELLGSNDHPWFPDDMVIPGDDHTLETWEQGAAKAAKHRLPSVLVAPVRFWDRYYKKTWLPSQTFRPYWTGPIRVHDMGDPPPPQQWRETSGFEVLCAIAQHPHIGSLRCGDPYWKQSSAQAYFMPERGAVVLDCLRSDLYHNRMYVQKRPNHVTYYYYQFEE